MMMMNAIEALEDAGYVFVPNVMQPEFDYPLDFWERKSDGVRILGKLDYFGDGDDCTVVLCPYDKWETWTVVNDDDMPATFVPEFVAAFQIFAEMYGDI